MQPWLSDDGTRDIEALINDYIAIHTAAIASDDSAVIVGCQTLMTDASPVQNDPPIPVPAFAARYATVVSNYLEHGTVCVSTWNAVLECVGTQTELQTTIGAATAADSGITSLLQGMENQGLTIAEIEGQ
jgi:hypothetical protein